MTEVIVYPYLDDNYGFVVRSDASDEVAAVDCGEASALLNVLSEHSLSLSHLLITHYHSDHTAGLLEVKEKTGCFVYGPVPRSKEIEGVDKQLDGGDEIVVVGETAKILHTPGHTLDMINYWLPNPNILFAGDTLFSVGCGRVLEGTMDMMWDSLSSLLELPGDTEVYSSHEYTLANVQFALTVDPSNERLVERAKQIESLRASDKPTVPSLLSDEFLTNPFLRAGDSGIREHLGMRDATDAEVFGEIRSRKDKS